MVRFLLLLCLLTPLMAQQQSPSELAHQAKRLEKQGKFVEAYLLYSQAAAADPTSKLYWRKAQALRTRAASMAKVLPPSATADATAAAEVPEDPQADPGSALPDPSANPPSAKEMEQAEEPQPPAVLEALTDVRSYSLTADSKTLWEHVAKDYGLDVIFDGDFKTTQNVRFHVDNVNYRDALYILQNATNTFVVPISGKLLLVVNDTPQKRAEQETHVTLVVPIPDPVTVQDAQELARSVQQVMEIQRFGIDTAKRIVFFRDRQSKARPAQQLLMQLMTRRPEVMLDVDLLSVAKTKALNFGIPLPTQAVLNPISANLSVGTVLRYLTNFGAYGTIGVGVLSTQLIATLDKSITQTMFHTELRTEDAQKAEFHVGDKYPIVTAQYTVPAGTGATSFPSAPMFTFQDLGLSLKVTPKVNGTESVTLDIEAEYKVLGGGSVDNIPIISTRSFKEVVNLQFGEWAVVSGLLNNQQARSLTGIAGLDQVPFLGPLFSNNSRNTTDSQTLLVIKPHLLSVPSSETLTKPIWIGPDARMRVPL